MTPRPGLSVRRRLDALGLRVQARLDADWADQSLPWVLAGLMFTLLLAMSLAVVRQQDGGPGLAVWTQAAWELRQGHAPMSSLAGVDPVTHQWAFVAYPLLWLTRWIPTIQLLAGAQALALALAVVPLWRLSRRVFDLRVGTTAAVVCAYALSPAVHAVNLTLFHPEVAAVPALAWAALFRRESRWIPYFGCIGVMLVSRADLGLTVAALGVVVLLDGDRLIGLATTAVGLVWSVAAIIVLDPQVPEGPLSASQAFAAQGLASLAEARGLFTDPGQVFGHVTAQQSVVVVVALFAPLLFLGFAAPRTLIPAIPAFVLGAASVQALRGSVEPGASQASLGASQVLIAVVPITVAGLVALSRVGHRSVTRVNVDHRLVAAITIASLLLFVQYAPSSPYQQPWAWGDRDVTDAARSAAVRAVADDVPITVSPQLSGSVAERAVVHEAWLGPPPDATSWHPTTPVLILDTTGVDATDVPLWNEESIGKVTRALELQGYEVTSSVLGIITFEAVP